MKQEKLDTETNETVSSETNNKSVETMSSEEWNNYLKNLDNFDLNKVDLSSLQQDYYTDNDNAEEESDEEIVEETTEETSVEEQSEETKEETAEAVEENQEEVVESEDTAEPIETEDTIDYKAFYEKITGEFKADGKMISVKDPDDIIRRMQMGTNFAQRKKGDKQIRRLTASLEKAGIKTKEDYNWVIDLVNGDKEALNKLFKDRNIDTYDLNPEEANYQTSDRNIISEEEVEFRETVNELQKSPHYNKLYDTIYNELDSKSKERVLSDVRILNGLHEEIRLGRFDDLMNEVYYQKNIGNFRGISDMDAYIIVLDKYLKDQGIIDENGNQIPPKQIKQQTQQAKQKVIQPMKKQTKVTNRDIDINKNAVRPARASKQVTKDNSNYLNANRYDMIRKGNYSAWLDDILAGDIDFKIPQ